MENFKPFQSPISLNPHQAVTKPPKPLRGGIPVCFPQVANFGTLEQHGFARNRLWSLDEDPSPLPPDNNQSMLDLVLKSTEEDLHTWPYRFELRLHVIVGADKLTLIPRVRNVDNKAFSFTIALRNYFSVSDVRISEMQLTNLSMTMRAESKIWKFKSISHEHTLAELSPVTSREQFK